MSMAVQNKLQPIRQLSTTETYEAYDYEMGKFIGATTFHGLNRLRSTRHPAAKLWWLLVIALSLTGFLYQMTQTLSYFLAQPTVSQVQFQVPVGGRRFPSVTVCNYNPIKVSYITNRKLIHTILNTVPFHRFL